jgi:hypothetical protein
LTEWDDGGVGGGGGVAEEEGGRRVGGVRWQWLQRVFSCRSLWEERAGSGLQLSCCARSFDDVPRGTGTG